MSLLAAAKEAGAPAEVAVVAPRSAVEATPCTGLVHAEAFAFKGQNHPRSVAGAALALCILLSVPLAAEDNPLKWASEHRALADHLSTAAVFANVGAETITSWRAPDRKRAFIEQACETAFAVGFAEITKLLVHRTRPDGSDRKSFFSEHTAVAAANSGWNLRIGIPLAGFAGYGRTAANKHFLTDVLTGAAVGAVGQFTCSARR